MAIRFGVSRSHPNIALLDSVRKFARILSHGLGGSEVKMHVANDYDDLLVAVTESVVDFAWMPPIVAARAIDSGAVLAAVHERNGAVTYRSGLLVRADSPLRSVDDLVAIRAAWTDPQSAAGCVLPKLLIRDRHPNLKSVLASEQFYGTTSLACGAVVNNEADLCASFINEASVNHPERALEDVATVYKAAPWRLRVLALTESIASDGIVIGAEVPRATQLKLTDALLKLHTSDDGAAILKDLMRSDRLVRANNSVDKSIASLRLRMR